METFVVRVFVPLGEERLELAGLVEHVSSGRAQPFRGASGLLDAVLQELDPNERLEETRKEEQ
jgi:hypothetical protein